MTKVTVVTDRALPNTLPRPHEYRDPQAPLPATRIHTWLFSTACKGHGNRDRAATYLLTALIHEGLKPQVSYV